MSKNTLLSELINYISANSSGNVVIAAPTSGFALDVTGTGRFTGALSGTSATFTGNAQAAFLTITQSGGQIASFNSTNANGGYMTWGTSGTTIADIGTAQQIFGSGGADTFGINARGARSLVFGTNNAAKLTIASTGAATFTSSVTATSLGINVSSIYGKFEIAGSANTYATAPAITFTDTAGTGDSNRWIVGNIATDYGSFNIASAPTPSSTTWTPRITINKTGNVGIGTTTPGNKLTIAGSSGTIMSLSNGADADLLMNFTSGVTLLTPTTGILAFGTSSTERMRITSGGNVGIGTTSALQKLTLAGTQMMYNTAGDGVANTVIGSITSQVRNYGTNIATNSFASIQFATDPTSWFKGDIRFLTNGSDGTGTAGTERMRITSGGDVNIGGTAGTGRLQLWGVDQSSSNQAQVNYDSQGNVLLLVRNDKAIYAPGVYSFTTGSGANVVVFSDGSMQRSTSSIKYKKNVTDYTKGLNELMQMRPVTYEGKGQVDAGKTFAGLIAEEIHDLGLTEFVQYAEDGTPDALAYSNMVALLTKSIQELKQEIDLLKQQ